MSGNRLTQAKKPRRTHKFGGCATCRKRHVKCDQIQPSCLTCDSAGLVCDGYRKELKWVSTTSENITDVASDPPPVELPTRRHLYSEKSRLSMNHDLQSQFTSKSIDQSLSELDTRSKDATSTKESLSVGPFGVFSLNQSVSAPETATAHAHQIAPCDTILTEDTLVVSESPYGLKSTDSIESFNNISGFLDWPDLFELDFEQSKHFADGQFLNQAAEVPLSYNYTDFAQDAYDQLDDSNHSRDGPAQRLGNEHPTLKPESNFSRLGGISSSDAHLLLNHFKTHVIAHISSLPADSKSHWEILHLRAAILSLADVEFMEAPHVTHAAMTNLFALLAMSAKHMSHSCLYSAISSASHWDYISNVSFTKAREHLRTSLKTETQGESKAKYKDQGMALTAMLCSAILYDSQQEARAYMIDSERLLRTRGFAKRAISRKVRILHHFYTWIRIIGESSYVLRDYENCELAAAVKVSIISSRRRTQNVSRNEISASGGEAEHRTKLDDFLRLESLAAQDNFETCKQKDHDEGLRDIHLEDSREFSGTMYMQLYGIQEAWLSLVSQTTRLANVIDTVQAKKKEKSVDFLESLERRKQRLENMVCAFAAKSTAESAKLVHQNLTTVAEGSISNNEPRTYMVRALNSALVIFFYRRIRNVNPWILQNHVSSVMQALKDFEASCRAKNIPGPGSPWPCFMAGCEAMSQFQREYFADWLNRALEKTGFVRFKTHLTCMQEVWENRDKFEQKGDLTSSATGGTWIDVSRKRKLHVLLS